jgi:Tfp pilus assembly protein PilV
MTPLRRTDGFTLIESMIALFFLSFLVGELAMVDVGAKRSAHLARQITKANTFADEGMEKTRNILYAKLQLPSGNMNETCAIGGDIATCTSNAPIEGVFTRRRIVTPRMPSRRWRRQSRRGHHRHVHRRERSRFPLPASY